MRRSWRSRKCCQGALCDVLCQLRDVIGEVMRLNWHAIDHRLTGSVNQALTENGEAVSLDGREICILGKVGANDALEFFINRKHLSADDFIKS